MKHLSDKRNGRQLYAAAIVLAALAIALPVAVVVAQEPEPDVPSEHTQYLPLVNGLQLPEASDIIPGQYIVVLEPDEVRASASSGGVVVPASVFAEQAVATYGGELLYTYDAALSGFAAMLPDNAIPDLQSDPNVAYIEPDRVVRLETAQTPATWGLDRVDQRPRTLDNTYNYFGTGQGVHVYVVDTGILESHSEFAGRLGNGYTAIADGRGTTDCNGHGTHVSGTVGGTLYGVAKGVTLHAVRVLNCSGSGTNSGVIAGVDWVKANRVNPAVANMSLGGSASSALDTAVSNAVNAGVTFAVAAGNSNANACNSSPARAANAITVGATTSSDARASYSNYGTCLDIFAPGSGITSAWYTSGSATAVLNGTSMASPHVAGAAALYLGANPAATPAQVRQALVSNATSGIVTVAGSGSPNLLLYTAFMGGGPTPTATNTPTVTPTPTGAPTKTPTPIPTATSTPLPSACSERVGNGGFEAGRSVWSESSARGFQLVCSGTSCGTGMETPHGGTWATWLAGANSETAQVSQAISLPAATNSVLSYWYWLDSSDFCNYDYGYARLIVGGSTIQLKRYNLCASTRTNGWVREQIDVSQYAGKTVTLVFRATTDYSYPSDFFVDDVSVLSGNACVAGTVSSADLGASDVSSPVGKPLTPEEPGRRQP